MIKRGMMLLLAGALAVTTVVACGNEGDAVSGQGVQVEVSGASAAVDAGTGAVLAADVPAENSQGTTLIAAAVTDDRAGRAVTGDNVAESSASAFVEPGAARDEAEDDAGDSAEMIPMLLNGSSISVDGDGVTVEGSTATITTAGTYSLSGTLADGQIVVDSGDEGVVRLILNGVVMRSSTSAPIYVVNAEEAMIVLADGTENIVANGESYVAEDAEGDGPNAAIFSKADLTIAGNGALAVTGNANDGITSKDGLTIASGTITVTAADDGIRGKDYLVVQDGTITVSAQGDGLVSDNEEDASMGTITIEGGVFDITSGGDAIQAQTAVRIADGNFELVSGGGSSGVVGESTSAKGIKAVTEVTIDGGTFAIEAADDAIHSNGSVTIDGGVFTIATGDDGLHADATLTINGGDIEIADSYEGIESAVITINGGDIHVVASDDGINVAGGNDDSGMMRGPGGRPGPGGMPGAMPGPGGMPAQDAFTYAGSYFLYINGGTIAVEAAGDGIDVNGAIEMSDGVVLVHGPTEQMNGALDFDAGFTITGGVLLAAGSAGMAQAPGGSSTQPAALIFFNTTQPAGTLVHIQNSAGEDVLTFAPAKAFQSLAVSTPQFVAGESYDVYVGGSATGTGTDGLVEGGAYTPGTHFTSFAIS